MRTYNKVPARLPKSPALIRERTGDYAIWTGRSWFGSVDKIGEFWHITTPGSPSEALTNLKSAKAEANYRALRAEGRA